MEHHLTYEITPEAGNGLTAAKQVGTQFNSPRGVNQVDLGVGVG